MMSSTEENDFCHGGLNSSSEILNMNWFIRRTSGTDQHILRTELPRTKATAILNPPAGLS